MTGHPRSEPPAGPSARLGSARLSGRLIGGDPTALADAYTRFAGRLLPLAAGHGDPGGVVRAVLARLWEHPLRYPAGDDELAEALAAATSQQAVEQPPRGAALEPGDAVAGRRAPSRGLRATGPTAAGGQDPRADLLATALAFRPAVAAAPPYAAPFAAWAATVDRVLAELTVLDWDRPTGRDGRTPREVVARLAGLDAALTAAIGIPVAGALAVSDTPAEGIVRAGGRPASAVAAEGASAASPAAADAPGGKSTGAAPGRAPTAGRAGSYWPAVFWPPVFWPPVLLWRTWHEGARGLCAWLAGRAGDTARAPVDALGWTATLEDHLTGRMLGTWLDGHAIAAVAGVRLPPLGAGELDAAARLALGRARWPAARDAGPLTLTLTLTGPGPAAGGRPAPAVAGRWSVGPSQEPLALPQPQSDSLAADRRSAADLPGGPGVRLDVVDFCLLVTGRRGAAETGREAVVIGCDPARGRALLAGMAAVLPA
jgi:hypothetical protein